MYSEKIRGDALFNSPLAVVPSPCETAGTHRHSIAASAAHGRTHVLLGTYSSVYLFWEKEAVGLDKSPTISGYATSSPGGKLEFSIAPIPLGCCAAFRA
jgi:hypothetical protein